jgi:hypothetical protein
VVFRAVIGEVGRLEKRLSELKIELNRSLFLQWLNTVSEQSSMYLLLHSLEPSSSGWNTRIVTYFEELLPKLCKELHYDNSALIFNILIFTD